MRLGVGLGLLFRVELVSFWTCGLWMGGLDLLIWVGFVGFMLFHVNVPAGRNE